MSASLPDPLRPVRRPSPLDFRYRQPFLPGGWPPTWQLLVAAAVTLAAAAGLYLALRLWYG